MHVNKHKLFLLCFSLFISIFSTEIYAAIEGAGVLDNVANKFLAKAKTWETSIKARATFLFYVLAVISLVFTGIQLVFRNAFLGEYFGELIRFILFLGFFQWLLVNGAAYPVGIIQSFRTLGSTASGFSSTITPSTVVDIGFSIYNLATDQLSLFSPGTVIAFVISLIILVILALVGINMLIMVVSGWILAYAGVFYLGFGGGRWTSDIAISYYKTILSIGLQTLTMILLIGIGNDFINDFYTNLTPGTNVGEYGVILVASLVLLVLTNKVPPLIGGIVQGGGLGALGGGYGAGSAITALGAAAGAAAVALGAVGSTLANVGGLAKGLYQGYQQASLGSDSGGGGQSSLGFGGLSAESGGSGGTSSGSSPGIGPSPLEQAQGHNVSPASAAAAAAQTGNGSGTGGASGSSSSKSPLVKGASALGTVAVGALKEVGSRIGDRVDDSFLGKVASNIKDENQSRRDALASNSNASNAETLVENSLSGEDRQPTQQEEIDRFVNRPNREA